ncbi:MAG: ATP-binding protein [Sedimentitalea sp.]|uniref:ATP-binding protein n=1 Tax=Sedimentitalea sp. TaxID=2048915 RepID=UPI0032679555
MGSFHGRDIHVHFGVDTVPASFRRRIKQFVDGYLGSERLPVAFGGRSTELDALNAWFENPDAPSHLLVAAEAGRGKTALLVRWLEQLDNAVPLAFVPISIRYQTSRPSVFFQAFAARLAYLLGETLPTASSDPAEFYKEKLAEYLEALEDRGKPCLIVVDGLDEATGWQFDAGFLPECTGSCLRVLVSARILAGDQDETGWLRRLEWDDSDASVMAMRIPPLNPTGIADVLRQTDPQLAPFAQDTKLVADLDRLTAGDPLLLTFYVADLRQWFKDGESGRPHLSDSDAGFGPYFERWLKKQGGIYQDTGASFDERIIKAILVILACAIGPLPLRDLAALVERLTEERHLIAKDTMIPLERFIVGDGNDLGYALGHPKLRNYIRDEYFGGSDNVDRAEGVFVDWGRAKITELANGDMRADDMPHYLLQFHAQHLQVVGADVADYRDLLSPTWRTAWEADRQGEGYLGLSNDVEIATHALINAMGAAGTGDQSVLWADILGGALISSSIQSLSSGIPPALLAKALEHDALAVGSALHFAERRDPAARLKCIAAVAEALPDNRQRIVLEEAFASITAFADETDQGNAIADLAPFLPADLQREALEFALCLGAASARQSAFLGLIPVLRSDARNRTFDAAFATLTPTQIFNLVAALAPQFYEDRQQDLLALAKKGSNLHERALAFREIADVLDAETQQTLAQEALRNVRATDHTQIDWKDVQNALSPLRAEVRGPAIAEIAALTATRYTEDVDRLIELKTDPEYGYDQHLCEDELRHQCEQEVRTHYALAVLKLSGAADAYSEAAISDLVQTTLNPTMAFQCYSKLALHGSGANRQTYIDEALTVLDQEDPVALRYSSDRPERETIEQVEALSILAQLTDGDLKNRLSREAVNLATTLPVLESAQCLCLLPESDRPDIIRVSLHALSRYGYVQERQETLEALAPYLDENSIEVALRVATRVSTGDDLALLIKTLSGHLSGEKTHLAFAEASSFTQDACLSCLKSLGPHLNDEDAKAALDCLANNDLEHRASSAEVEILKSLPAGERQSFMQARLTAWRAHILENIGSFATEPVLALAPAMTKNQRYQILNLFFDYPPNKSEFVVADLLDKAYVGRQLDARDKIKAYLERTDTQNALNLSRKLRDIFQSHIHIVLPDSWMTVRGIYDLPRHYALGNDLAAAELMQETERFAKNIRRIAMNEDEEAWSEWQEWNGAMKNLPAEAATRHADFLCAYLRESNQPDDPEVHDPDSPHAHSLLAKQVSTMAQMCGPYLSSVQLHALLDYDAPEFHREIIVKAVFMAATGPVFDRVKTQLDGEALADLSCKELTKALKSKTRTEALQIYSLWRAQWPNVVKPNLAPFLPFFITEDIPALAENLRTTAPEAYLSSLPDLLNSAPTHALPEMADRALAMLPETVELSRLTPLVIAARGHTLSRVLHQYARGLGSLSRKNVMEEISSVSGALSDAGLDGSADAIYDRVSTVLTHWQ